MIRIAGAAACLLLATPAAARGVELLSFAQTGTELPGEAPHMRAPTEITTALAQDFSEMAAAMPRTSPPVPSPEKSSIQVPRWMQTGLSPLAGSFGFSSSASTLPLSASTCNGG